MIFYLRTGQYPEGDDFFEVFSATDNRAAPRRDWEQVRDAVLREWVVEHPGTRPWAWWQFDAPEPRRRVGGVGHHYGDRGWHQTFAYGLPVYWIDQWMESYYNGRARDVDGNRIGVEYHEGQFPFNGVDPDDPPRFESQAGYLDRHRLLSTAERRALPVGAFEPECITVEASVVAPAPTPFDQEGIH